MPYPRIPIHLATEGDYTMPPTPVKAPTGGSGARVSDLWGFCAASQDPNNGFRGHKMAHWEVLTETPKVSDAEILAPGAGIVNRDKSALTWYSPGRTAGTCRVSTRRHRRSGDRRAVPLRSRARCDTDATEVTLAPLASDPLARLCADRCVSIHLQFGSARSGNQFWQSIQW